MSHAILRRITRRTFVNGAVVATAGGIASPSATAARTERIEAISVTARRVASFNRLVSEPTDNRFGTLRFNGGLVLTSPAKDFGGFSGLVLDVDGERLVAVSDAGYWLGGRLTYENGQPSGVVDTVLGPILARDGHALRRKRDTDAEAASLLDGSLTQGTLLIAFERAHRIGRFPVHDGQIHAPSSYLGLPPEARQMSRNKGFEAVTVIRGGALKGAIVAFSERFPGAEGQHSGWIWQGGRPYRFAVRDADGFDITDAVGLDDGSILILGRRFRWYDGVRMQVCRIAAGATTPGALITPTCLLAADLRHEIDNMEGIAVHRTASGETCVTLLSDNNFSSYLQRTLLLQFILEE